MDNLEALSLEDRVANLEEHVSELAEEVKKFKSQKNDLTQVDKDTLELVKNSEEKGYTATDLKNESGIITFTAAYKRLEKLREKGYIIAEYAKKGNNKRYYHPAF